MPPTLVWIQAKSPTGLKTTVTEGAVVAIDGKTLRCRGKGKGAIHMVSAFSAANGVVLGQVKTAEKKEGRLTCGLEAMLLVGWVANELGGSH